MKSFEYIKKIQEKLNEKNLDSYSVIWALNEIDDSYTKENKQLDINTLNKINEVMDIYINSYLPVQYQFGYSYFYGNKFIVTKDTLIPRFDTEEVVEKALSELKQINKTSIKVCDIGCGSGVIGITVLLNDSRVNATLIDISTGAVSVTRKNVSQYNLESRCEVIVNDLLNDIDTKYDMIISNPPYIDNINDCAIDVITHEPHSALFAKCDGMEFYEKILKQAKNNLAPGGVIVFEIGYNQEKRIIDLVNKLYKESSIKVYKDLNNNSRIAVVKGVK